MSRSKREEAQAVLQALVDDIQHLPKPVLRKLMPALRQAQREVEDHLTNWLAREDGDALFTTQRYRNALVSLRRADGIINQLAAATEDGLWAGAERAAKLSKDTLEEAWTRFGRIFEGTIQPIALPQAAIIASGDNLLIDRFESSAATYAGEVRETIIKELAVSRLKEESIFELTERLTNRIPHIFEGQRYAAERLARTETLHAYNVYHYEGIKAAVADDPEMEARWDGSFDWRRCPMCASLDGQIRDVAHDEKFEAEWVSRSKRSGVRSHRAELVHPPAHPSCRCILIPWRRDWPEYARPKNDTPAPAPEPIEDQKVKPHASVKAKR